MNTAGGPRLFVSGDRVIGAVGDLVRAADCEFALLRAVDAALGNLPGVDENALPLVRAAEVSPEVLRRYGDALVRVESPDAPGAVPAARIAALTAAAEQTLAAVRAGAAAIKGAVFFDGRFACGVDLLVRDTATGRYMLCAGAGGPVGLPTVAADRPPAYGEPGDARHLPESDQRAASALSTAARAYSAGETVTADRDTRAGGSGDVDRALGSAPAMAGQVSADFDEAAAEGDGAASAPDASGAGIDSGRVSSADPRVMRRELAAGRTPFERATASVVVREADSARIVTRARLGIAACAQLLAAAGIEVDPWASLSTAAGEQRVRADELAPVYLARRARLERIVEEKSIELLPVQWGDPRYLACGRCARCRDAVRTARDLLLVAGIRPTQRARLREAGVLTIDRLATTTTPVTGLTPRTVTSLRRQAEIQLQRETTGAPAFALRDATALGALPAPSAGDLALLIDLDARGAVATVELADARSVVYQPTMPGAVETEVLDELLDIIGEHRAIDPDVRVYHYGSGVRTALLDWAGRLGTGADLLDELLADGALVDLAPITRTALLIGEQSYDLVGLTALLPTTGPADSRADAVGPDGATTFDPATNALDDPAGPAALLGRPVAGRPAGPEVPTGASTPDDHYPADWSARAGRVLALRDWLLERAAEAGIEVPGSRFAVAESDVPPSLRTGSLEAALTEFAAGATGESARAAAVTAAVLGYHRRERQPRWWAHIDRLGHPVGEWADSPGVLVAEWGTVDTKWHRTPQLPTMRRYLTLTGRLGTGATLTPGTQMVTIYDGAAAAGMTQALGRRATATATVLGCAVDANFDDTVRLEELLPAGCPPYDDLPAAIAPGPPDGEAEIDAALELTAQDLLMTLPGVPETAVFDLLLRRPPRLRDGMALPEVHGDVAAALAGAVGALDASYLAVHGPPGTGKTGTTGRAIERLVTRHRWRIGVVAQSHAVIERIFDAVVDAGLLPELVAKKDVASVGPEWSAIDADRYPRFLDNAVNGCVIGGTTADFVDENLIVPGALDLLVIADAGASSLADTVAVAVSARNLLLIGDPVPARAQAAHPEPVQVSALEWLCDGAATLPEERGYFLDRTWRMHPALCDPVSASCYDGRLRSSETITLARDLAGIAPGVSTVLVEHRGSATESDAEAREVVRRVRALLGETWTSGGQARRLHPHDVFVVAPYAAQVARIRTLLARAKIEDVLVGTPDRFRGREAAVVVLSMTTSTPADAPFGMRTLLSRTMIHATLCRAMWKAIVIRSPLLTEYLPDTPDELDALAAFLRLS
ncbi:bifunctional RecB family nuclease/DEAD/DEAH box helicase [Nocardia asteroides]|uniref:bifunctional RecB family nuclease/DEAD/DEAH box helicase n=1 Tax=Nocardia asteroides TaxID=1824 RepID=UPI001E444C0B|nr:bifunctional RecB family nuclease/DEAD/DEAH box helicase [Nocardia asteroides]UGT57475.1 AAA domain-containing protein [Nocardia asteroides]